jgi:hypothetical protein
MFRFAQRDSAISKTSSRYQHKQAWTQAHGSVVDRAAQKKIAPGFFHGAIPFENYRCKSGFCFLCGLSGLLTLRFQLSELLCRKNSSGLLKECVPAFLCAACFHAFSLPRLYLCLLI